VAVARPCTDRCTVPEPDAAEAPHDCHATVVAMTPGEPQVINRVAGLYAPPPQLGTVGTWWTTVVPVVAGTVAGRVVEVPPVPTEDGRGLEPHPAMTMTNATTEMAPAR
jgi:hypothetical protein